MKNLSLIVFAALAPVVSLISGCGSGSGSSSTKTTPTITWATPAAVTVGTALSSTQLDATASVGGTFVYSPVAGTVMSTAGTQTLSVTFTPTDTTDYNTATDSVTLTVNSVAKITPTITWAAPAAVTVGAALSSTQLDATASVGGAFVYSPVAGTVMSTAGTQTLSVMFTPTDTTDYNTATASVSLTVNAAVSGTPSYSWNNVRIVAGGYVTGLYFSTAEQNLMYARTDIGGAYRWGPSDTQWVPLLDSMSRANNNWTGVEALGLDPTDANKLYMAVGLYDASWAGDGAMLVSDDQGATYTTVPLNFKCGSNEPGRATGNRIAVDPNLDSIVYFGTRDNGLQISTNSGMAWNQATGLSVTTVNPHDDSSGTESDGVVAVLPIQSSGSSGTATPVVYAIVAGTGTSGNSQGIYVTTNGGSTTSTWTEVAGQPSLTGASQNINETGEGGATYNLAPLEARLSSDGSIYILYGDQTGPDTMNVSQLWRFQPGTSWTSGTWSKITLPDSVPGTAENYTPDGILYNSYGGLALDPSKPGSLLLGTLDQYTETGDIVYLSTDYGVTWRDVSSVNTGGISKSQNLATHDNTIAPYFGASGDVSTGNWPTAMAIDPFNSAHAMYGFGGGLWMTTDLGNADPSATSTGVVAWDLNDLGIEETAIGGLWAPPSGNTLLLSSIGDVYGFAHTDLTVSPAQGNFKNPNATPSSMDFEQNTPTTVVRVTDGTTPFGVISVNGGLNWTGFAATPTGSEGGGTIAIAPDGSSMVWATEDTSSVWYSTNSGASWTASTGIAAQAYVIADRYKAGVFYGLSNGTLSMSTDGGATFTTIETGLPSNGNNPTSLLVSLPDAQGDLWFTAGNSSTTGLYANTGTAASPLLTVVSGIDAAYHLAYGKAATGSSHLTLYLDGTIGGAWGLYRSTDGGATWIQINDAAHQWGGIGPLAGDMRTFGTVYVGTWGGRGIIWGTSAN